MNQKNRTSFNHDIEYVFSHHQENGKLRETILAAMGTYCQKHAVWGISPEDLEDLGQEILMKIYMKKEAYKPEKATVYTWANKIAINELKDQIAWLSSDRCLKYVEFKGGDAQDKRNDEATIASEVYKRDCRRGQETSGEGSDYLVLLEEAETCADALYARLSPEDRKIVDWMGEDCSNEQIAEKLGMKKGTAATRKCRIKALYYNALAA